MGSKMLMRGAILQRNNLLKINMLSANKWSKRSILTPSISEELNDTLY